MQLSILSIAVALCAARLSLSQRTCDSNISDDEVLLAELEFKGQPAATAQAFPLVTINVHFHVIAANTSIQGGWLADGDIQRQVNELTRDFSIANLAFNRVNTTRTINPDWFHNVKAASQQQHDMKMALRAGGVTDLNIYSVGFTGTTKLGYASYPLSYRSLPWDDGIVILYSSLPGGTRKPFNLGKTAVHETGHWVGLYHTFQTACTGRGDHVDDTPAEASPAWGCPHGRDSCVGEGFEGIDPIYNFMDYSDDGCMDSFTQGQVVKMRESLAFYRGIPV
ncbi:metalloprotease [Coprinopsis marcescibilis]|uniref:Metalloprotease n=1 Tax=Coprinopsis marcescibilis TaxID=230819 RepID=A0A5C3KHP3_COPMA|nr:metalloprotease [Coprinopsis marcescibilis]